MMATQQKIARRPNRQFAPLSFAQQRLWFLDQLQPGSPLYNVPKAIRLKGSLNVSALHGALFALVERHEVLRSVISVRDGNPLQVITDDRSLSLPVTDLSLLPPESREHEMHRLLETEARRPFDLSSDLMIRAALVRMGIEDHVLLLVVHHIACDGWSIDILLREIAAFYTAFSANGTLPLPALAVQYADFTVWQRQWLQGRVLETQLSYWKEQLAGVAVLKLPTDRPRPAVQTYRGAREPIKLPKNLSDGLKALSRNHRLTPFMMLLAGFQTLLYRYTGQDDIAVGSPIANRTSTEIEGLIGFFANTLALRADLSDNPSFLELVSRVRQIALDAYEHQDLPIERLVEDLNPDRSVSHSPLFQAVFAFQSAPKGDYNFPGLTVSIHDVDTGTAKFDVTLSLTEDSGFLTGFFEYNTDLFEPSTIQRMSRHFQILLGGIVANPEQRISDLPLLTDSERQQVLVEWNKTKRDFPGDCIHQLFEAQAERTPEAMAVMFDHQSLTYEELNRKANQLAHYLKALNVGPEVPVAICVERSLEVIVALLGILKAGGLYVPLDPAYPHERLAFMLHDTGAAILLTQERLSANLPQNGARIVCLDRDWQAISQEKIDNPRSSTTAENLAYVIYTSGSTGRPKGVSVTHRGVVRLVKETGYVILSEKEVFLQFAPLSFDASTFEIWACLLNGAKLVVFPPHTPSLEELGHVIRESGVTTLWLTSALFQLMVDSQGESLRGVRQLLAGGDVLPVSHVRKILEKLPDCQLINAYGPTENTTFSCCYPLMSSWQATSSVPIGRPIANSQVYILDGHFNPVPIGVPGELYVGGDGLARGYLNQSALTAEKFIPDPFADRPGARLYQTGDVGRYLADGNIEFIGRKDYQVKIRGFRVEPGEIEALLGQHPGVQQSLVLAREDSPGDKRLVAYVSLRQPNAADPGALRDFLQERLPNHMLPSAFVLLDAFPLNSNGKVDRKALPAPDISSLEAHTQSFVAPRSPVEERLVEIWAELLKVRRVGVQDDFFDLGGHSLLATQLISRVRDSFDLSLPLRAVFEHPTVARLATHIEELQGKPITNLVEKPTLPGRTRRYAAPASFGQERLWFLQQMEPNSSAYNMLSAFRLKGRLNVAALEQSLDEISRRHEVLQASFEAAENQLLQVIARDRSRPTTVLDLTHLPQSQRERAARTIIGQEARKPFDLANGPVVRAKVLRIDEHDHIFLYLTHHIVSDGWSLQIFYKELSILYEAFCNGKSSPLEELPLQYTDFASWQKQWLKGEELQRQLTYWKKQLAGTSPLHLPLDRARPALQTYEGARQSVKLREGLVRCLNQIAREEHATLFMILLAAFKALLQRYTGQDDIIIGSPVAGRNREEIEGLIGFFVNTVVLRGDLSGNPTFRELLARIRSMTLDAFDHQDLPFEKLVEELKPGRDLSRTPLFDVFFNMFSVKTHPLSLGGLAVEPLQRLEPESKFDLTFYVREDRQKIDIDLVYNANLFHRDTALRMLDHFQILLEGIAANPEQRLSALPILGDAERHQLLFEWNDTRRDYPNNKCIHQLFEEQVERTPDAVAVSFEDTRLSYRQLNQRANQLAHYLRKLGVGSEVPVGLCMERCLEMVVALLGILKAGGAYVPLDPEYPQARVAYMSAQAGIRLLVTKEPLQERVSTFKGLAICLDRLCATLEQEHEQNLDTGTEPDNLAYIIYTSGSTGRPKGVLSCHRGVVNYFSYLCQTYNLNSADTVLQLPSLSFDASVRDLIGPLTAGAHVVVVNDLDAKEPTALLSKIKDRGVTCILSIVPTLLNGLLEASQTDNRVGDSSLRLVLVSGEPLTTAICQKAKGVFGRGTSIVNQYGPTETTMTCSYHRVVQSNADQVVTPLGRPIPNDRMHILDRQLNLVPIGIPGELHIGGVGVSRGYVNSPDLTAESFIPDPFNSEAGARLYRTGDLARYRADGSIDFLGRLDHQVKIRGFRVEIGEIEAVLTRHLAVQQAVVVAREDIPGQSRLIAYIVPSTEAVLSTSELRNFLKSEIPEYMIPWMFVVLEAFPLTPNRKVDRSALPAPEPSRSELTNPFVEPRTIVEEALAKIWAEVLNLEQVGIHDNFFDLGGHSLRATQVLSRTRKAFHVELPLRAFFENPTVSDLAVKIAEIQAQKPNNAGDLLADMESLTEEEAGRLISHDQSKATLSVERDSEDDS